MNVPNWRHSHLSFYRNPAQFLGWTPPASKTNLSHSRLTGSLPQRLRLPYDTLLTAPGCPFRARETPRRTHPYQPPSCSSKASWWLQCFCCALAPEAASVRCHENTERTRGAKDVVEEISPSFGMDLWKLVAKRNSHKPTGLRNCCAPNLPVEESSEMRPNQHSKIVLILSKPESKRFYFGDVNWVPPRRCGLFRIQNRPYRKSKNAASTTFEIPQKKLLR